MSSLSSSTSLNSFNAHQCRSVTVCLCVVQYLITEMIQKGVAPDSMTYGSLIAAYADVRQPRRAAAVMQEFIDSGGKVSDLFL